MITLDMIWDAQSALRGIARRTPLENAPKIGENLYINLTNRCSNRCTFCVRDGKETYEGHALWLKGGEPTAEQVIAEIKDPKAYREIVFCGFGEPTYRLAEMLEICRYVHKNGGKTRLNTNGHGNVINNRNIAPDLAKMLDGVNISLNAPDAESYNAVCPSVIENAFYALLEFAGECKKSGVNCWFSVVDCIGAEAVEKCRKVAEKTGIPLRVREFIE